MTDVRMLASKSGTPTLLLLLGLALAAASFPLRAQQPDSPDQGDKTNSPSGHLPRQQAPPPGGADQQATETAGTAARNDSAPGHRPPDARWHAPIAAFAGLMGITALLAHFGLAGPVASAVGGIAVIGLLLVGAFLLWWHLIRKYRIVGRRKT